MKEVISCDISSVAMFPNIRLDEENLVRIAVKVSREE